MSIWNSRLKAALGPAQTVNGQVPWDRSREEIGIAFPDDFREFIDAYGSVTINKLLHIWSPQRHARQFNAPEGIDGFAHYVWFSSKDGGQGQLRDRLRARWPETQPYPIWPEAGGLILWGRNERHHQCYWAAEGDDPNAWPIVLWFSEYEWFRFETTFSQFLYGVISGESDFSEELIDERSPDIPLLQQNGGWDD